MRPKALALKAHGEGHNRARRVGEGAQASSHASSVGWGLPWQQIFAAPAESTPSARSSDHRPRALSAEELITG